MSEARPGSFEERYRHARTAAVVIDRSKRVLLEVTGKAPGQMLGGVVTGRIPGPLRADGGAAGARAYSTILTPKGKMVSDLFLYRSPREEEAYLLDLPPAASDPVREHFRRVLPPRLARVEDVTGAYRGITIAGPEAVSAAAALAGADEAVLADLDPDEVLVAGGTIVARSDELPLPAFDLLVPGAGWDEISSGIERLRLPEAGADVWETLRIEAGTPAFGLDMTSDTIPIEAGIEHRAIDHGKGCYTGQEVIVRILHRGHVNWHLRKLVFADGCDVVPAGGELFQENSDKPVGRITSSAWSPAVGRAIALGYVRREVEMGAELRLGGDDGATARVLERGALVDAFRA